MVQGEDFGVPAHGKHALSRLDGKPVVIAGPCSAESRTKFWTLQDSSPLVDVFDFCAQAFGNLVPGPTALKAVASRVCPGSWRPNKIQACRR